MAALTTLGIVHTAVSLVALASGLVALVRDKEITSHSGLGQVYLISTLLTAATGLGIFAHGGFGPPHALSILTLLALAVGYGAGTTALFGRHAHLVQMVSYTTTFLFHMIPGFTETLTRLPVDAPVLPSADAPQFKAIYGVILLLFVVGLALQVRWLRRQRAG